MASNVLVMEKNGDVESPPPLSGSDLKILVLGDRKCGKTRFIKAFTSNNLLRGEFNCEFATLYDCGYEITSAPNPDSIKIYEINGAANDQLAYYIKDYHFDANGYIFLFALDDPESLENMKSKWIKYIEAFWKMEPAVVVGTKRDLKDPQPSAQDNQVPFEETVRSFFENDIKDNIKGYFEFDANNADNINDIFYRILVPAREDRIIDTAVG